MQSVKRSNHNSYVQQQQHVDATTQALQNLGMRIRKSVSDGYQVPSSYSDNFAMGGYQQSQQSGAPSYMNSFEQQHQENYANSNHFNDYKEGAIDSNFKRVPLPGNLQGPPSLMFGGSTASSLSNWENEINVNPTGIQTIPYGSPNASIKRRRDGEVEETEDGYSYSSNTRGGYAGNTKITQTEVQLQEYVNKYGPLSFDDEF
ncbi:hypothetical protein B5S32_g4988 [[Candida] boidinii]|nr:hypothetical protein B5S32_g4988 [[Candida] boidinii]